MNENKMKKLKNLLYEALDRTIKINIELVNDILPSKSGKKKTIITKEEFRRMNANN
jgi:hypothetical protein